MNTFRLSQANFNELALFHEIERDSNGFNRFDLATLEQFYSQAYAFTIFAKKKKRAMGGIMFYQEVKHKRLIVHTVFERKLKQAKGAVDYMIKNVVADATREGLLIAYPCPDKLTKIHNILKKNGFWAVKVVDDDYLFVFPKAAIREDVLNNEKSNQRTRQNQGRRPHSA